MDLRTLSTQDLEHLIDEYPWFTLARKVYIQKLANGDREKIISFVKESSFHLLSRIDFIRAAEGLIGNDFTKESIEEIVNSENPSQQKPRQYIVGGDYFGKEDFQQLSSEGLAVDVNFSFSENTKQDFDSQQVVNEFQQMENTDPDVLYTETLAEIYANQELYSQAIEIYNQLILLYPEKNAYFASLIENIKNKIN